MGGTKGAVTWHSQGGRAARRAPAARLRQRDSSGSTWRASAGQRARWARARESGARDSQSARESVGVGVSRLFSDIRSGRASERGGSQLTLSEGPAGERTVWVACDSESTLPTMPRIAAVSACQWRTRNVRKGDVEREGRARILQAARASDRPSEARGTRRRHATACERLQAEARMKGARRHAKATPRA